MDALCVVRVSCLYHQKSTTTINSRSQVAKFGSGSHTIEGAKTEILASLTSGAKVTAPGAKVTTWGAKSKE